MIDLTEDFLRPGGGFLFEGDRSDAPAQMEEGAGLIQFLLAKVMLISFRQPDFQGVEIGMATAYTRVIVANMLTPRISVPKARATE